VALLVSEDDLSPAFDGLEPPSMSLHLDGVGFFSGGDTAFLRVARSRELFDYQHAAFEVATRHKARIHEYYTPGRWVPHCTIAQHCTRNLGVPIAFSSMDVQVRSLILVEFPPTRLVGERHSGELHDHAPIDGEAPV